MYLDKEKEWIENITIFSFKFIYEYFPDTKRPFNSSYGTDLELSIKRSIPYHASATIEHILLYGETVDEFFKDLGIEKRLPDEIGEKLLYRFFKYHNKERGILL